MRIPRGILSRLCTEALDAVRTCRDCGTTAWPWEIYREAPATDPSSATVEYVCPEWPGCST